MQWGRHCVSGEVRNFGGGDINWSLVTEFVECVLGEKLTKEIPWYQLVDHAIIRFGISGGFCSSEYNIQFQQGIVFVLNIVISN